MANTYTQLHIHLVFAVKYREAILRKSWKGQLQKYITSIIQNQGHKLLIIENVEDHMHILIGLRPVQSLSALMEKIKTDSSLWINNNKLTPRHFNWQNGYGAFALSKSHVEGCIKYIANQEEHHRKKSFREEYLELLMENDVEFDERYIFKELE
ncbi:MAG TPA: IS200/IS605 family transposase [Saprospiraceae bacterium]|nr:IS200/IS605 family transposase [Saprospiraceae bacterium]